MNAVDGVNWSRVAADAFEVKLSELAERTAMKGKSAVIQRLKASKIQSESEDRKAGYAAGKCWAEKGATWEDLRLTSEFFSDWQSAWDSLDADDYLGLPKIIDDSLDEKDVAAFWDLWACSRSPSPEFIAGFYDAATDIFAEVREEI